MEGYAYYNGKIGRCDDISIPLTDRLVYFGDGVYDVITGHSGKLFLAEYHLDRLFFGIKALDIIVDFTKRELLSLIEEMIAVSAYSSYLLYISISRSANERRHSSLNCTTSNLLIIIKEFQVCNHDGLNLITLDDNRYNYCNIKTVNLLPSVIAATEAEIAGCDEAIFIRGGIVTECAHSNIFILRNDRLITHPESTHILPGIIRKYLIKIAADCGVQTQEQRFTLSDLFDADEVIITSTTKLVKEAITINGNRVGGKNKYLLSMLKHTIEQSYQNI